MNRAHVLLAVTLGFALTLAAAEPALAQTAPAARDATLGQIRWEAYETMGSDEQPLRGELGRLLVPERRDVQNGKTIELAFVRFRTTNPNPAPPVVILAGGPGGSGIEGCVGPATGRRVRLLDFCDVIGLDQRGTGLCRPNLSEGPDFSYTLPSDKPLTRADVIKAHRESARNAAAHWKQQGVDLTAYNTQESADDIEDLRRALELPQIMTWGASYGSHLGLAHLRRHASRVARSILMKVEGPDHTLKLPSTTQRHLVQLHQLVAADPELSAGLPDLLGTVRTLLKQLAQQPAQVSLERDGGSVSVTLGPFDLQSYLANSLGLVFELAGVPAALHGMTRGDWSTLAEFALENRRGGVDSAMALMMDCSSGASPARHQRIQKETADKANLLGDAVNVPYPGACSGCGDPDLGADFRTPFTCDVPVLFVSGSLDARTPPENVEELQAGFTRHAHIVAENVGHEPLELLSPEYLELLKAFLRGETVESRTLSLPPPRFQPLEAAGG
ncbi:MAG: alpha/beta fold hydrolase [Planctomycetota bacterium]